MKAITIPIYEPYLGSQELKYITSCVKSGWISSAGEFVNKFASAFSKFLGVKYAVPVSTGTAALHLAVLALGIKRGDEVIVPALTFASTVNVVLYVGAKPVFVDVELSTFALDPTKLEKKISDKTRAIIVVHLYGQPANMGPILKLAKKYHLYVIEDAAEAHGAEYQGRKVGSIGHVGCFSFYANKIITTGEGGMLVTNSKKIAKKAIFFRDHAMDRIKRRYWHTEVGYNYPMTALQAAIGLAQLEKIEEILVKKQRLAEVYYKNLSNISILSSPSQPSWGRSVWWLYTLFCKTKKQRDGLLHYLNGRGIDARAVFYPLPEMPPYRDGLRYPIAKRLSKTGISLPSSPCLTGKELQYIIRNIFAFFKKRQKMNEHD